MVITGGRSSHDTATCNTISTKGQLRWQTLIDLSQKKNTYQQTSTTRQEPKHSARDSVVPPQQRRQDKVFSAAPTRNVYKPHISQRHSRFTSNSTLRGSCETKQILEAHLHKSLNTILRELLSIDHTTYNHTLALPCPSTKFKPAQDVCPEKLRS